jgi:hypothetical protein
MTLIADAIPADEAPPVDTGSPQILGQTPLNSKGEPRRSGPRGGRPRKTPVDGTTASATPRNTPSGSRTDPNVNQAINTLGTAYDLIVMGLTMLGAQNAASELSEKIPAVQSQNRQFLTADPRLAARIANIGSSTGRAGFLITNLAMLVGVGVTAAAELSANRPAPAPRKPAPAQPDRTVFDVADTPRETPASSPLFPGGI